MAIAVNIIVAVRGFVRRGFVFVFVMVFVLVFVPMFVLTAVRLGQVQHAGPQKSTPGVTAPHWVGARPARRPERRR